jgi:hypothetical protein
MKSVLQDWVMELPLREQGVLLTSIRGCDLTPKLPYDAPERQIVGWIRNAVLNAADPREIGITGAFFQTQFPSFKWSEFCHYPLHWVIHILHTLEVIGYRSPNFEHAFNANDSYLKGVHSFHLLPESKERMIERLSEDRFIAGTVVS